jgi:hypothetical protein
LDPTIAIRATATVSVNNATIYGDIVFDGVGATFTLGSNFITLATITLSQGTLTTSGSNYTVSCSSFVTSSSNTKVLTLNASTVNITSSFNMASGTNLTLNAGTSTIALNGTSPDFYGAGKTYYIASIIYTGATSATAVIQDSNSFTTLTISNQTSTITNVTINADQTVFGTFTASSIGSSRRLRLLCSTQRTISAGTTSLSYVDFKNIIGAGTAAWTGTSLGNIANNSGITFTSAVTRYAKVASASGYFTTIGWAATSGGATGASVPLPQDTVVFDSTAGAGTYDISNLYTVAFIGTGFTQTVQNSIAPVYISGSITLPAITQTFLELTAVGTGSHTLTTNANPLIGSILLGASNFPTAGTYTLVGNLVTTSLSFASGVFTVGANNVTSNTVGSTTSLTRTINMGSGIWTLNGTSTSWSISDATNLVLNAQTATIVINASDTSVSFSGGGISYPKITVAGTTAGQTITFSGDNTIAELASTKTVPHTVRFSNYVDNGITIGTWSITGSAGNLVTVDSSVPGTRLKFDLINQTSGIDYLNVKDIQVFTPKKFYVGTNSIDSGNNLNVIFTATPSISSSVFYGALNIESIFYGSTPVTAIYYGSTKVF